MLQGPTYDLIVIGGGLAGSAAAITAARSGARVLLLESGRLPRHKVCGEFVSPESLGLLGSFLKSPLHTLVTAAPRIAESRLFLDGRVVHAPLDPPAASMARFDLDFALLKSAAAEGVEIRTQTSAEAVSESPAFRVSTTAGEFSAAAVVNASGRWSKLRGTSHAPPRTKWIGLKAHFSEPGPPASVDLYFFDGGYCGVQPVKLTNEPNGNRINACAMVKADIASNLDEVLALHPALRERSLNWQPLSAPVSTSPLIFHRPQPESGGILFAGDAACFVDPFVGDGISLALRSGALASECLLPYFRNELPLHTAASDYAHAYRERFASVFSTSSTIRKILLLPRPIRRTLLGMLERTPAVKRYLIRKTR